MPAYGSRRRYRKIDEPEFQNGKRLRYSPKGEEGARLKERLSEAQNHRCAICGGRLTPDTISIEHIIPFATGGADDESNFAVTHKLCNSLRII
jgi:5-methylcytosine-specific restriction endonuclease McrA